MEATERKRNPFVNSAAGGRALSALQLPLFLLRPPAGYAVLTTTGRKTGKTRRRCIRAARSGDRVYVVAIKGVGRTGWAKNALASPHVRLRLPGGTSRGRVSELGDGTDSHRAEQAFCETVRWFDYLTWLNWRTGRPTSSKIRTLLRGWFEAGTPLVIELV